MKIHCLIIDDEQPAREMLAAYAKKVEDLEIIAQCKNPLEAKPYLTNQKIDLLLLDIQMPRMTGVEFLRQLPEAPKVIFTTAYKNYAIEGYELEVVDYLLKPIGFQRFEKAIEKVRNLLQISQKAQSFEAAQSFENQSIIIKEAYDHHKIFLKDIIYISAMREYVQYHTKAGRRMALASISSVENSLPAEHFIRINRSYIIAKSAVKGHQQNQIILTNDLSLPLGKTYKKRVMKVLFE